MKRQSVTHICKTRRVHHAIRRQEQGEDMGKSLHCGFCGKGRARQGNQAQEQHHWLWDVGPQPSATRLVALSMAA